MQSLVFAIRERVLNRHLKTLAGIIFRGTCEAGVEPLVTAKQGLKFFQRQAKQSFDSFICVLYAWPAAETASVLVQSDFELAVKKVTIDLGA